MYQNLFLLFLKFKTGHEKNLSKILLSVSKSLAKKSSKITDQLRFRSSH